jgi:hypothetical protein
MVIPGICSEHAWHLYILIVDPTLGHVQFVTTGTKKITFSTYSYNKIYDEQSVDMLLPLDTINKFLVSRFIDVKKVQYKNS